VFKIGDKKGIGNRE